jgi:hypothetical protein
METLAWKPGTRRTPSSARAAGCEFSVIGDR